MTTTEAPASEYIATCPIGRIRVDPINPRTHITVDTDFVQSIAQGILEPLIVRVDPAKPQLLNEPGPVDFLLIAGHRRLLAAEKADLATVPVVVRHDLADDKAALVAMITENGQREDLPPLDEARGIEALVAMGMSQREAAKAIGREQGTVSKRLSLLKLPTRAQQLLDEERITVKTALGLTGLVKDNGRLSRVLDWAASHEDADDARIAELTFRELQTIKGEAERQKQAKKSAKLAAELTERGLRELDSSEDDYDEYVYCDEADATAFEIDLDGHVHWQKLDATEDTAADKPGTDKPTPPAATGREHTEQEDTEPAADTYTKTLADATIAEAARDYVDARFDAHRNPGELEFIVAVDSAWEHLRLACGYSHADFDEEELPSTVIAQPTPDIATIGPIEQPTAETSQVVGAIEEMATQTEAPDLPDLEEPWAGYEAFGAARNIKVIRGESPWVTPDSLRTLIAYETARTPSRQPIIDAAQHRLDELATVDA